ncbi:hypothetical protein K402DRAFT_432315 [Aulographum hederae CBS 113979]|uniref:HTH CENPB-type domain-containing protein n=1 Tax=Aulographum hederae CBS 113979 TaxID=1176131 RepID=A0A6G1GXF9_9PEZI|nr:hypothetical protein K402DRAFT_432315 [Aulographum hederae CBS 113979]
MDRIDEAIADLRTQSVPNFHRTAKKYGLITSTLSRRFKGQTVARDEYQAHNRLLNETQEAVLVKYINNLSDKCLPPTTAMVGSMAAGLCKKQPGKDWVPRFVGRHREHLQIGFLEGFDLSRKKADNAFEYRRFFEKVWDHNCIRFESGFNHFLNSLRKRWRP